MRATIHLLVVLLSVALSAGRPLAARGAPAEAAARFEFTRMVAHWAGYADSDYVPFIEEARVELAQVGFYGAHFWSLAHTPHGKGYPAHFPVVGLPECGAWFETLNGQLHERDVKVVGHFNIEFLVGDPESDEGPRGFFKFYRELWDEQALGPKPVADPVELLEKQADGSPIRSTSYSIGGMAEYWGCLNNPHWRTVLKAWVKQGVARGVDGFMINYFYRHNCLCPHCRQAFSAYLADRFEPAELRDAFGVTNLATHVFDEILAWHAPAESTPLRREMLRFSQIATKQAFDEVFVTYGRSLKPDLIVGQWNHLGNFNQINGDERCLLPAELWGRDESYLWYSMGGAGCYTDLAARYLGEGTLQMRYIRGAFDDKPFTLGKYESTRTRVAISELAANGGAPMGFYARFSNPDARRELVRYYRFIADHEALFRASRPYSEALLLYPRSRVHEGDVAAVAAFRELGGRLLDQHVLFEVAPDDAVTPEQRAGFGTVFSPLDAEAAPLAASASRFEAPWTVRVSANRCAEGDDVTLHFVNYNREEPSAKRKAGSGIQDEKPIPVAGVQVDFVLPAPFAVQAVTFLTPESEAPVDIEWNVVSRRLRFALPEFLVYGLVRLQLVPTAEDDTDPIPE